MDTVKAKPITIDDLLLEENHWREVVRGEWVNAMTPSYDHVRVAGNVFFLLTSFVRPKQLGQVMTDGLHYVLSEEHTGLQGSRIPDASFLRKEKISTDFDRTRPFRGTPDLAVEVVSPSEDENSLLEKIRDYLAAGTEEVWVLYPAVAEVHRYRREEPKNIRVYSGDDELESQSLFPGLKIRVADFFAE